jgi:hypothetical protein
MLEQILSDMAESVEALRKSMEEYAKAVGSFANNPKWAADVAKAKSKGLLAVKVAKANHKALENELKKLGKTAAGRKEIDDKLMRIFTAQERLIIAVMKAEEILNEDVVQSAQLLLACEKHMGKPSEEEVLKWARDFLAVASEVAAAVATGEVASKPAADALDRIGSPANAGPRVAEADKGDKKNTGGPAPSIPGSKPGKHGNLEFHSVTNYVISIPPNAAGKKFPLVVLFAGNTKKGVMLAQTPASYYQKAILVFGERDGAFSAFESGLKKVLNQARTSYTQISICGYSSGGQAAIRNYKKANHKVGLIDPTLYDADLKTLDSKVILSIYPNPGAWKDVIKGGESAADGRINGIKYVRETAKGFAEETKTSHDKYPGVFLSSHESKLI